MWEIILCIFVGWWGLGRRERNGTVLLECPSSAQYNSYCNLMILSAERILYGCLSSSHFIGKPPPKSSAVLRSWLLNVTSHLTSWHTSKVRPFLVVRSWKCVLTIVITAALWQSGQVQLLHAEPPAAKSSYTHVETFLSYRSLTLQCKAMDKLRKRNWLVWRKRCCRRVCKSWATPG